MNDDTAVLKLVDDDPVADDPVHGRDGLAAELAAAAPRRWWNRGTLVLGLIAMVMAGFLGGLLVQKNFGAAATAAGGQNGRPAGFPGGGGFGGQVPGGLPSGAPAAGATAAAGTNGTVKLVDGTTIYVQTEDGTVVTVRTGDSVTVQGAADAEGTVTATTVTRTPKK